MIGRILGNMALISLLIDNVPQVIHTIYTKKTRDINLCSIILKFITSILFILSYFLNDIYFFEYYITSMAHIIFNMIILICKLCCYEEYTDDELTPLV